MNNTQESQLSLWQVILSILASFIGIQKHKNMQRDMAYLERRGFVLFLIVGFTLAILLHLLIYCVVLLVLPEGSSGSII
jgi:hypothetical protein